MAHDRFGVWDWNELLQLTWCDDERLGQQFLLELAPDLILSPHLYGWNQPHGFIERGRPGRYSDFYTLTDVPAFVLYAARGDEPIRFLREDLAPAVLPSCRVVIIDADRSHFWEASEPIDLSAIARPLTELPGILNGWLGEDVVPEHAFDNLALPWKFPWFALRMYRLREDLVRKLERTPARLWELFFARGHGYRWELLRGEVPLVTRFPTEFAANRSLLQCVADAERLEGRVADERCGWIKAGRFRMRQRGLHLDVRVRLTAADMRVAFMPTSELPDSDALPTLAGVLIAGGDNGKTEMMDGYTWSTVVCIPGEASRLAAALRETILGWCSAPRVDIFANKNRPWPRHRDGRWEIAHDDTYLTVYTPMYREDMLPWEFIHPNCEELVKPIPLAIVEEGPEDQEERSEKRIRESFGEGATHVWVVRREGRPRIEVREANGALRMAHPGDTLELPGVLRQPVPVAAFFTDVAARVLQQRGGRS